LLLRVPPGVVTTTEPVVAPLGTTAVMYVSLKTLKLVAETPLKVTPVESRDSLAENLDTTTCLADVTNERYKRCKFHVQAVYDSEPEAAALDSCPIE
jgi:hypothetical protein